MVTPPQLVATILTMAAAGAYTYADIGRVTGVARRTVSDIAKRAGAAPSAVRAKLLNAHHLRCAAACLGCLKFTFDNSYSYGRLYSMEIVSCY